MLSALGVFERVENADYHRSIERLSPSGIAEPGVIVYPAVPLVLDIGPFKLEAPGRNPNETYLDEPVIEIVSEFPSIPEDRVPKAYR